MSASRRRRLLGIIGVGGVLGAWELAAQAKLINTLLLGQPTGILQVAITQIQSALYWEQIGNSALVFVLGIGFSAIIGIAVGLATGWSRRLNYFVDPWLTIWYSAPIVALIPLLILVFGIDLAVKVVVIFLFAVFPIALNTLAGVHATANRYLRVARVFQASDWMILRTVVLPGAIPYIVTGLRVAGGRAFIGLVSAELLAGQSGIGYLLSLAGQTFQTNAMMFHIAVIGMGGVAYTVMLRYIENVISRWRPALGPG